MPEDDPAVIGSGLLANPAPEELPGGLPAWVASLIRERPEAEPARITVSHQIIANLDMALTAAAASAERLGFAARVHPDRLRGDSVAAAVRITQALKASQPGVQLWGGETTPRLPRRVGCGGRNQHLALCCATEIRGRSDLQILCVATDGSDGNTAAAGGLVDGRTLMRGRDAGLDAARCLARADSAVSGG